jgi:hypothetical protein
MRETVSRLLRGAAGAPLGGAVAAIGVVLLVAGWYGISGESVVARQLPYLASATIPGAALLASGVLLTARTRGSERDRHLLEDLHSALLETGDELGGAVPPSAADADGWWATAQGTTYHRAACPLVRQGAELVDLPTIRARGLSPCPICEPPILGS